MVIPARGRTAPAAPEALPVPYSLVSAATLGFDLVRLPAGGDVADVLLTGLAPDEAGTCAALAAVSPAQGRDREAARGARRPRPPGPRAGRRCAARARRRAGGRGRGPPVPGRTAPPSWSRSSSAARSATPPPSSGCSARTSSAPSTPPSPRSDEDTAEAAADVLADAAVGHWAAEVLPPLVRRELAAPFARAARRARARPTSGPRRRRSSGCSASCATLDEDGRARWRAAVDEGRGDHRSWAAAMHEASWAAHVSGRTRALAAAQLQRRAGLPRRRLHRPGRRRRPVERRRRLRPGPRHGRPARRPSTAVLLAPLTRLGTSSRPDPRSTATRRLLRRPSQLPGARRPAPAPVKSCAIRPVGIKHRASRADNWGEALRDGWRRHPGAVAVRSRSSPADACR